jgi:hypothetical protein
VEKYMKTAIVFDLDGTLIDSAAALHAACVKMLALENAPAPSLEDVISYIGNGVPKLVERAMTAANIPMDQHSRLVRSFMKFYEQDPATLTTLYPNLLPLLDDLIKAGHRLSICTNKPEGPARVILDLLDIQRAQPVPRKQQQRHAGNQHQADAKLGITEQARPRRRGGVGRKRQPRQRKHHEEENHHLAAHARH